MLRPWDAAAFRGHDVSSFSLVVVDQFHIEGVFSSNRKTMRQFARTGHRPETAGPNWGCEPKHRICSDNR